MKLSLDTEFYQNRLVHSLVGAGFGLFVEFHVMLYTVSIRPEIGKNLVAIFVWGMLIWLVAFGVGLFVAREVLKYFAGKHALESPQ